MKKNSQYDHVIIFDCCINIWLIIKANAYYFNSNPACSIRLCFCDQRHCSHATKPYV